MKKIILFCIIIITQLTEAKTFLERANSHNRNGIVNIPDADFKNALLTHIPVIDTNGDNEIQHSEAEAFTGALSLDGKNISNLTGIEAFTAITQLYCHSNNLTSLDVSANTALQELYCFNNQLTSLNISTNTALQILDCYINELTSLDLSNNRALTFLACSENQLINLDLSNNKALTFLSCSENQLTSLDISTNTALQTLYCYSNQLTNLNASANILLRTLLCSNNQLTNLTTGANTSLFNLECQNNQLTDLDISANTALEWLSCKDNHLTNLNIANGNNGIIQGINALNNPNLSCIKVDNASYSNTNWTNPDFFNKPAGASYSESCTLSTSDFETLKSKVYPNPTSGVVNIVEMADITVFDINGRKIIERKNAISFDLSAQCAGIYLVQITTKKETKTIKIIKK